jgi:tungstate transport system substrate-binding protein
MANDFVLIGPTKDPAGIRGKPIKEALLVLKKQQANFVSRGDDSGTHQKEIKLWIAAGISVPDKETWYVQTGQGMITTIHIAEEQNAYTLTDRGTYIKYETLSKEKSPLAILVEGDTDLLNQYSVIAVNPAHCPSVNQDLALQWIRWITSAKTQQVIKDFKILGKPLFIPNAKNPN